MQTKAEIKSTKEGIMRKKQKLNYRFHNPNTPEATAEYMIKILIEVNKKKVERILLEEASKSEKERALEKSRDS